MATNYRPLEIDMLSANDLANMNYLSKMDVYIVSLISSDRRSIERTPVDKKGGTNPKWKNYNMKFNIDESAAQKNQVILIFQIISRRILGDKTIGFVHLPVKALLDEEARHETERNDGKPRNKRLSASYQVSTLSGKPKGTLCFMYSFGKKFKVDNNNNQQEHEGYNYSTPCQECGCNYNHLPIAYNLSHVGPMNHQGYTCEYSGTNSVGQNKRRSCFGLGIIFDWGVKFFKALFRPVWLMPQIKML